MQVTENFSYTGNKLGLYQRSSNKPLIFFIEKVLGKKQKLLQILRIKHHLKIRGDLKLV